MQLGGFVDRPLGLLLETVLLLMKNVLKPLAKSFLVLLGLKAATSATDVVIQKENWLRYASLKLGKANNIQKQPFRCVLKKKCS